MPATTTAKCDGSATKGSSAAVMGRSNCADDAQQQEISGARSRAYGFFFSHLCACGAGDPVLRLAVARFGLYDVPARASRTS